MESRKGFELHDASTATATTTNNNNHIQRWKTKGRRQRNNKRINGTRKESNRKSESNIRRGKERNAGTNDVSKENLKEAGGGKRFQAIAYTRGDDEEHDKRHASSEKVKDKNREKNNSSDTSRKREKKYTESNK